MAFLKRLSHDEHVNGLTKLKFDDVFSRIWSISIPSSATTRFSATNAYKRRCQSGPPSTLVVAKFVQYSLGVVDSDILS